MFEKVLVANRGEIAVRVMRACEELGIDTVAVYSAADKNSGHVRYADEAYNVGPPRAAESYLNQEALIDAARRADADAIHPGYGFLAENADFAARVEAEDGLTWIGPTADAMAALGGKTKARQLMADAGVPIVPGTMEPVDDAADIEAFAEEYGYPVAIKAEGGGGGRGMKIVREDDDIDAKLGSARREGEAYFDNDNVYLERYLENPRHVEVQILADDEGSVRHLGERDCSLQRRHQKVIEEAPSPALTDGLRERLGESARSGVEKADYTNAGTVEFLVEDDRESGDDRLDADASYYFLEVNTRIQVEHCVTEAVTGIDIVKWQIRIAAGETLSFAQDDVAFFSHAIEYRINAENAAAEFTPATGGMLETYDPPGGIGVRVDDALCQGDALVTDYDSMIAKLIVAAPDRDECLSRSKRALAEYDIHGIPTIVPFHRLMLDDEAFLAGTHTTKYLDDHLDRERIEEAQEKWSSTAEATADETVRSRAFTVEVDGRRFDVNVEGRDDSPLAAAANGGTSTESASSGAASASQPGTTQASAAGGGGDSGSSAAVGDGEKVQAEMQGTILDVSVEVGQKIAAGDVLCVLEAMKMENDIVSDRAGTVTAISVESGQSVDMGDPLMYIE